MLPGAIQVPMVPMRLHGKSHSRALIQTGVWLSSSSTSRWRSSGKDRWKTFAVKTEGWAITSKSLEYIILKEAIPRTVFLSFVWFTHDMSRFYSSCSQGFHRKKHNKSTWIWRVVLVRWFAALEPVQRQQSALWCYYRTELRLKWKLDWHHRSCLEQLSRC